VSLSPVYNWAERVIIGKALVKTAGALKKIQLTSLLIPS
jgi:hypothetical protein